MLVFIWFSSISGIPLCISIGRGMLVFHLFPSQLELPSGSERNCPTSSGKAVPEIPISISP